MTTTTTNKVSLSAVNANQLEYYPIQKQWKKLKPIDKSEPFCEIAHMEMERYAENRANHYGYKFKPTKYSPQITPSDYETCDWRYMTGRRGRHPAFWDYVCHGACHWTAPLGLIVAQVALPERDWVLVTSKQHTTVWDSEHTIMDANFLALNINVAEAWKMAAQQSDSKVVSLNQYIDGAGGL